MIKKILPILLILLVSGTPIHIQSVTPSSGMVPAPEFISIDPTGNPVDSRVFDVNQTVTVQYLADRFQVDGILLLGVGSNLTTDINSGVEMNLISSHQGNSTYEGSFNVTSYTYFYAYAWSVTKDNGTVEVFDSFDGVQGHQIWVKTGPSYPEFTGITGAVDKTSNYYAPIGSMVTIEYQVLDPLNSTNVTLALGLNTSEVLNSSLAIEVSMVRLEHDTETNYTRFGYNHTMNERITLFSAYNEVGWERAKLDTTSSLIHTITTGFSFVSSFEFDEDKYTDIDEIKINVTAYNQTVVDAFFVRYRVFENSSINVPLLNWTDLSFGNNISYSLNNDTNNYNTTEHVYQKVLGFFNLSQVVEVQAYVNYKQTNFNESQIHRIEIRDSRPSISFALPNATITNSQNSTLPFSFSNVRGEVLNATLVSNYTSSISIKGLTNTTVSFSDSNGTVFDGKHVVNVTVFNTLNVSRTSYFVYRVDQTPPEVQFLNIETSSDVNGQVTISFIFSDKLPTDTGLKYATLDWGDGVAINVLNRTSATHIYRQNATEGYTFLLTVYDIAGNMKQEELKVNVVVTALVTTIDDTPFLPFAGIMSIAVLVILKKKPNNSKNHQLSAQV